MRKTTRGFTIVELLIVIVVIAILAAIAIVAYNGIQQRARNMARLSAAANIYKQLELYTRQTGNSFGTSVACIPTEANYDAGNGGLPDCYTSGGVWSEDATVSANLAAAGFNKFNYPTTTVVSGATIYRGIAITYFSNTNQGMNGILRPFVLMFVLEGSDQDCGSNSVRTDGSKVATDPLNSIIPAKNMAYGSAYTMCTLSLTHQSSI